MLYLIIKKKPFVLKNLFQETPQMKSLRNMKRKRSLCAGVLLKAVGGGRRSKPTKYFRNKVVVSSPHSLSSGGAQQALKTA